MKVEGSITTGGHGLYDCLLEQTEGYLKPVYSTWRRHLPSSFLSFSICACGGYNSYLMITSPSNYIL